MAKGIAVNPVKLRLNSQSNGVLNSIRCQLTPEHQQGLDEMTQQQKRALIAVANERTNGEEWVVQNFSWLQLEFIKYLKKAD
jgi:hypothetical protein